MLGAKIRDVKFGTLELLLDFANNQLPFQLYEYIPLVVAKLKDIHNFYDDPLLEILYE